MVKQSKWLPRLIVAIGIMMVCGVWLLVRYQVIHEREVELENAAIVASNLSKAFEEQVHSVIADADGDMRIIQRAYEKEGAASPLIAAILEQNSKNPVKAQSGITDDTGRFIVSSDSRLLELNYGNREWFLHLRENVIESLFVGKAESSRISGKSVIPLSRWLKNPDGSFAGVAHVALSLEYFDNAIDKLELGEGGVLSINRMDGVNLLRKTKDSQGSGQDVRSGLYGRARN